MDHPQVHGSANQPEPSRQAEGAPRREGRFRRRRLLLARGRAGFHGRGSFGSFRPRPGPDAPNQLAAEHEDVATEQHDNPADGGDYRRDGHHRLGAKIREKHQETSDRIDLFNPMKIDPCPEGPLCNPTEIISEYTAPGG